MGPVIAQAVERVWLSGALWQSHPWQSVEHAFDGFEDLSDLEQLELFQKAIAALKSPRRNPLISLEAQNFDNPEIEAAIGWEISEIEKACKFLSDRVHGNVDGQMSLLEVQA